jgi:hypothetical protein
MGGVSTVFSPVPDFRGRMWVTGRETGIVGVLDTATGTVRTVRLGTSEGIYSSFAVTGTTAFIVTDRRIYRGTGGADGVPMVDWSVRYLTDGKQKPGQISDGSGTTPTILGGGRYVAIVDNAPGQEHVVVYRAARTLARGMKRDLERRGRDRLRRSRLSGRRRISARLTAQGRSPAGAASSTSARTSRRRA